MSSKEEPVTRVRLVHWKPAEAAERVKRLEAAGYAVELGPVGPGGFKALRKDPPAAVLIDLGRLPSHGREVGTALRGFKATRRVPLVFVGGEAAKVERIRGLLPDAEYCSWRGVRGALKRALARPPTDPVVPKMMAGYSGTPLPKKLGIKPDTVVALVGAPEGFEETLGELPSGARLRRGNRGKRGMTLWFPASRRDLEKRVATMRRHGAGGGLWIAWPKKSSGVVTDLTQAAVRELALAAGLVDFKICAVDATYSGLRFSLRED